MKNNYQHIKSIIEINYGRKKNYCYCYKYIIIIKQ